MDASISDALQEQVMLSFKWIQELNYCANDDSLPINLAKAVGNLPQIPMNALDQPEKHLFLNGSCFRLPPEYCRLESAPQVKSFFDNICHGTTLSLARGVYNLKGRKCMDIVCSCGQLNKNAKNVSFTDGMNSKHGIKRENVKRQRTPNQQHIVSVMPRWDKKKNTKKNQTAGKGN